MLTVLFPSSVESAAKEGAARPSFEFKAGGTDVVDRVRHRAAAPEGVIQLSRLAGLGDIREDAGVLRIGAMVSLAELAEHPTVSEHAVVLAEAALTSATPQIRAMATLGGALAQRVRCPYFRDALFDCAKKGGASCLAREGEHHDHAVFNNQVCMAPHASTVGAALLALDAVLKVRLPSGPLETWSLDRFFTIDFKSAQAENALPPGAIIEGVEIKLPPAGTRQSYLRAAARHLADWPSVEVAVVLKIEAARMRSVRIVLGGVDRVPHRALQAEAALAGNQPSPTQFSAASKLAARGATPGAQNAWKVGLIQSATLTALEEAMA